MNRTQVLDATCLGLVLGVAMFFIGLYIFIYFDPNKAVILNINKFNEANVELFMMLITLFIAVPRVYYQYTKVYFP